jgi:hypothetical protein
VGLVNVKTEIDELRPRRVERRSYPAPGRAIEYKRFTKMTGSLLASIVIVAQLFAAPATARTFSIPRDQPVASVEIPDWWHPVFASDSAEGSAMDGAARLAVEFIAAPGMDAAIAAAIARLGKRKVAVAPETRRAVSQRINGLDRLKVDFSGTDSNGDSSITLILVAAAKGAGFVAISYWGDGEAQEAVANDLLTIVDSLELLK